MPHEIGRATIRALQGSRREVDQAGEPGSEERRRQPVLVLRILRYVARQIRSGICHVNGPTVHDEPQMPFGGVGASGYGRFGGKAGIDQFTELRWITIETQPGHFPI